MKSCKLVNTVLISSTTFLAGCYGGCSPGYTVVEERAYRDGVPVVSTYMPGYHYSGFYGGYVPIIVPIGGFGYGHSYTTVYNSLPPSQRTRYAAPVTSPTRKASPVSSGAAAAASRGTTGRTATPVNPGSGTVSPSTTSRAPTASSTGTSRGIAGGIGFGSVSS